MAMNNSSADGTINNSTWGFRCTAWGILLKVSYAIYRWCQGAKMYKVKNPR